MLEERHGLLKTEYDKLRTKYQEDIKHWKEWKALDTARRQEKKRRKEDRHRRKLTAAPQEESAGVVVLDEMIALVPPSQESVTSQAPTSSQDPHGSQRVTRSQAKKRKVEAEVSANDALDEERHQEPLSMSEDLVIMPPPPSQKRRSTRGAVVDLRSKDDTPTPKFAARHTPIAGKLEARKKATSAARVTPWLGSDTKPRSTRGPTPVTQDPFDLDIEHHASPLKRYPSNQHDGARTPLMRDRGEGASLRRTALTRTFSTVDVDAEDNNPEASISRTRGSVSPAPGDSSKKRRLDMEGMSPAEKAQERKRLNNMTPAEKREMYAEYKGKGRYLPPDEV